MVQIRLNKFLASRGIASRRHADDLIKKGLVKINGVIARVGDKLDPALDKVEYANTIITPDSPEYLYYALNKPLNVLSSVSDDRHRKTVTDFIPVKTRIYPVGRLDYNSTGLILLTNDGDLTLKLTHPRYHLPKVYHVTVKGTPHAFQLHQLRTGVNLDLGIVVKSDVKIFHETPTETVLEMTLYQGINRQIRRMCRAVGLTLLSLHRISIGPISLGNLKEGEYRLLTPEEIALLKKR